jgi:hypothetical protein
MSRSFGVRIIKGNVKDYPLEECQAAMVKLIAKGATVYQKWTCGKCGARVTANNPNMLTMYGHHEDCGHVTDLVVRGCNYVAMGSPEVMMDLLGEK